MDTKIAGQRLMNWEKSGSTLLVRLDVKEASATLIGKITALFNHRVILDIDGGTFRVSLEDIVSLEDESKFGSESFTIRYPSGYCTFIGWSSKKDVEWPDIITELEQ
jgi:hypothetical protein